MPDFPVPSHISVFVQVLILIIPSDRLIDVFVPNVLPHFDRERYRRGIIEVGNVIRAWAVAANIIAAAIVNKDVLIFIFLFFLLCPEGTGCIF
jgi:hypothetical protein